jgi:hypothetical protein
MVDRDMSATRHFNDVRYRLGGSRGRFRRLSASAVATSAAITTVFDFFSGYRTGIKDQDVRADLTFGSPHEVPLPAPVSAIKARMEPQGPHWFAYKTRRLTPRTLSEGPGARMRRFAGSRHSLRGC